MSILDALKQLEGTRMVDSNGEIRDALPFVEEIVEEVVSVTRISDAEKRRELSNFLKEKENYSNENYVTCVDEQLLKIIPSMQLEEAGLVMRLLAFLSIEDGILKDNNGYIHIDKIIQVADKPERTVKRYVSNLVKLGVLVKVGTDKRKTIYAFNQIYHSRKGNNKGYFTKLWLTNLRERWIQLPLDTLGFLYRIMPYFNTYSCCLTANPYEFNVAKSIPFSLNALAEVLEMNVRDVRKHVNLLTRKVLVIKIPVGKSFIVCVNPQIFYRKPVKSGESVAQDIQLIFEQAEVLSDSIDDILAMRRFLRCIDNDQRTEVLH